MYMQGAPVTRLRVLPLAVLHNLSPLQLGLLAHARADAPAPAHTAALVPPCCSAALDWGAGSAQRPRRAILVAQAGAVHIPDPDPDPEPDLRGQGSAGAGGGGGLELVSEPFAVEGSAAVQLLVLRARAPAGAARVLMAGKSRALEHCMSGANASLHAQPRQHHAVSEVA